MSAVVLYIAASVDGFIARPDGDVSWLSPFEQAGEDYGYAALLGRLGAIVMGGATYRQSLSFGPWPYQDIPCYVFTRRSLGEKPPPLTSACVGDVDVVMTQLKKQTSKDIWLVGGADLIAQFAGADLIDEYIISVIPLLLGQGIPLFVRAGPRPLALTGVTAYKIGIVQIRYRRG